LPQMVQAWRIRARQPRAEETSRRASDHSLTWHMTRDDARQHLVSLRTRPNIASKTSGHFGGTMNGTTCSRPSKPTR
jgi:hypothetical protein